MQDMSALLTVPGLGKAGHCVVSGSHSPEPLRFVWHHIQPHEAGGPTVPANLLECCDSCHYSVHRLMFQLARGLPLDPAPRRQTLAYARQGYEACLAAGTVSQIPDEG